MATVKNIKVNGYCDEVNNELTAMKKSIHLLREDARNTYGTESEQFLAFDRHLCELADMIDWKLQLLIKACPFDWKGMESDIESVVSVGPVEASPEGEFSGGYIGG